MYITVGKTNNIYNQGYVSSQRKVPNFKRQIDSFEKLNNIESDFYPQKNAEKLLNEMQNGKTISQSDFFVVKQNGEFIMKSAKPKYNDVLSDKINNSSIVKEYAVLREVERIAANITAPVEAIINKGSENHIIQKFVKGFHPDEKYMSEGCLQDLISKLAILDENGVFHRNLNSSNILCLNDGSSRVIGFSDFSLLTNFGDDIKSEYLNNDMMYSKGRYGIGKFVTAENEERYAGSFLKSNILDIACDLKNYSDNPYLNVKSNISNFEYNHMFPSLKNNISENSFEYLKNYVRAKGQLYHAKMAEFLKNVQIKDIGFDKDDKNRQIQETAEEKLKKAIEYEELAQDVLSNPSEKVLKTETAKIQLKRYLFESQNSKVSKLKDAYNKTVQIFTDSISESNGNERKYLQETLNGIQERFKNITFVSEQEPIKDFENLVKKLFTETDINNEKIIETVQSDVKEKLEKEINEFSLPAKIRNKLLVITSVVVTSIVGLYCARNQKFKQVNHSDKN